MAPVAAANHDFNDFQHWLCLDSPQLTGPAVGGREVWRESGLAVSPAERFIELPPTRLQLIF